MEIERKWLLKCFPQQLNVSEEADACQGYISTGDTEVRIRSSESNGNIEYILTFKDDGDVERKEVEVPINKETFRDLADLIGKPLISKLTKKYKLDSGHTLEVSLVDAGEQTQFYYAEIEFGNVEEANSYILELPEIIEDVTYNKSYKMKSYWKRTRG